MTPHVCPLDSKLVGWLVGQRWIVVKLVALYVSWLVGLLDYFKVLEGYTTMLLSPEQLFIYRIMINFIVDGFVHIYICNTYVNQAH